MCYVHVVNASKDAAWPNSTLHVNSLSLEKAREKYATAIDGLPSISVSITSTMQGLVTLASTRAGSFMLRTHALSRVGSGSWYYCK